MRRWLADDRSTALMWSSLALVSGLGLWVASLPSVFDGAAWVVLGVLLVFVLGASWFGAIGDDADAGSRASVWLHATVPPAVLVAVAAVALSGVPSRARFAWSDAALDRHAEMVRSGNVVNGRVGGYSITWSSVADGEVRLTLNSGLATSTLVDAKAGQPADGDGPCAHLGASWYLCTGVPDPNNPSSD